MAAALPTNDSPLVEYVEGCHNQKEEQYLFPLIESRGIPRQGGPLAVMLDEHAQSKDLLVRFGKGTLYHCQVFATYEAKNTSAPFIASASDLALVSTA